MTVHLLPKRDGKEIMVEAARTVRSAVNIEQMDQVVRGESEILGLPRAPH